MYNMVRARARRASFCLVLTVHKLEYLASSGVIYLEEL